MKGILDLLHCCYRGNMIGHMISFCCWVTLFVVSIHTHNYLYWMMQDQKDSVHYTLYLYTT